MDRNQIRGQEGTTLLVAEADEDEEELDEQDEGRDESPDSSAAAELRGPAPDRKIYCIDLRVKDKPEPYLEEIRRIVAELNVKTVDLLGWIGGSPRPEQLDRYLNPVVGQAARLSSTELPQYQPSIPGTESSEPNRIDEPTARRWYPVIDYSRCTNCMECLDFCLFGVYGVDRVETILVEQPDNCRKGCPACSRVCPENAIIFPQHKTPAIAGSPEVASGGFKIDLSKLFGAPDAIEIAAQERDVELVAVGRDAVGLTVGIPKRQEGKPRGPKDNLDALMDELDDLGL
jgi:NAD-dependent dihydropyrimidine dehydrogenase PreA subunit